MDEKWMWVPGHEGLYEVSDRGRVRSHRKRTPRVMRQTLDTGGYLMVNLSGRLHRVHRLVLLAFIGPDNRVTRHLDDNPTNNALGNICYGTQAENVRDIVAHGHHVQANKTHCSNGHEFNDVNTYLYRGARSCRACNRKNVSEYKRRKRATNEPC